MKYVPMRSSLAVFGLAATLGIAACGAPAQAGRSQAPTLTLTQTQRPASSAGTAAAPTASVSPAAKGVRTSAAATPIPGNPAPGAQHASVAAARVSLAPAQLPAFAAESWTAQSADPVQQVTGHDIELNECASIHGATTWQQQAYSSSGGNSAILEIYTFASDSAGSAYHAALSGMAACQTTTRALQTANHVPADAVSRQTASATGAAAFVRTWTGVEGVSAAGPQTNHLYFAMHGTTLLVLHFDELAGQSTAAPYDVRNDPGVLSMLTNVLTDQVSVGQAARTGRPEQ